MKENKGKDLAYDEVVQVEEDVLTQSRPAASEKMKTLSRTFDTRSLPNRRGSKNPKHGSSKLPVVETNPSIPSTVYKQLSMVKTPPPNASPSLSSVDAPPKSSPLTLLRSEGLAQDRFQQEVTDKDISIYYKMSMMEFERSTVHDLFKIFSFVLNHMKN